MSTIPYAYTVIPLQTNSWRINEGVHYAYVPHLTNVLLVQLFHMAILTLQVWHSNFCVRVQVGYMLNKQCKNVQDRIFEGGLLWGVLWVVLRQALRDQGPRSSMFLCVARVL